MDKMNRWIKKVLYSERLIYLGRTALIVLAAGMISLYLNRSGVMKENILMVLLIGVLLTGAFTAGYEYGVIGAVASVLIFNYFFTVPVHTFAIMNPNDVALMIFFLIVSFISSGMTARFRRQVAIAEKNEKTARRMSEMSERFINVTGTERIVNLGVSYIKEIDLNFQQVTLEFLGEYSDNSELLELPELGPTVKIISFSLVNTSSAGNL